MITKEQIEQLKERNEIIRLGHDDFIFPPIIEDKSPYIYVCIGWHDKAVYVGQTKNISSRLLRHQEEHEWWNEVSYILCAECSSYDSLIEYERYYIDKLNPIYNIQRAKPDTTLPELTFRVYKILEKENFLLWQQTNIHTNK